MKKNNKGFTLVELIVVLVILAILAAILVPALLGWIDKAREKSVTTNAEAAYVAAQGLATEFYGTHTGSTLKKSACENYITEGKIKYLTDIEEDFDVTVTVGSSGKKIGKVSAFTYQNADYKAVWNNKTGDWTVTKESKKITPVSTDVTGTK